MFPNTIFSNFEWTPEDKADAQDDGWDIFDMDSTGVLEIQALEGRFPSDSSAREHVRKYAMLGNILYMKALLCIAQAIVERQLRECCADEVLADDIAVVSALAGKVGIGSWQVSYTSQATLIRTSI